MAAAQARTPDPGSPPPDAVWIAGPPTISRVLYQAVLCQPHDGRTIGPACAEAGAMYDLLIAWSIDPAVELAFAWKETEGGHTGPGQPPQHNLHNIVCNALDGGTCTGPYHARFQAYPSYLHATYAFARLMRLDPSYEPAGRLTVAQVLPVYAPPFENDTAQYIAQVEAWVQSWRALDHAARRMATASPPLHVPTPAVHVVPCRRVLTTTAAPLHAAPAGKPLRTLPAGTPIQVLCRNGSTVLARPDGHLWVQVADPASVIYPWMALASLRVDEVSP